MTEKRKPGRPKLPRDQRRSELVTVRLTPVERRIGERLARERGDGWEVADVLRAPLEERAKEEK